MHEFTDGTAAPENNGFRETLPGKGPSPTGSGARENDPSCPFCEIIAGRGPAVILREWPGVMAIRPRCPLVPGHVLVIPRAHVPDAGADPAVSAVTMAAASELAARLPSANVITSIGTAATQSVFHLHLHVLPRREDDGLALPWTGRRPGPVEVIYAREPLPAAGASVFLAGPTPRSQEVPSWRPALIAELSARWRGPGRLAVLSPESRGGKRAREYHDQVAWETEARAAASVVMFWIPRDTETMPGYTTNVEFGLDAGQERPVVLGCPPGCRSPERNRYLIWVAGQRGIPVLETPRETAAAAISVIGRARPEPAG